MIQHFRNPGIRLTTSGLSLSKVIVVCMSTMFLSFAVIKRVLVIYMIKFEKRVMIKSSAAQCTSSSCCSQSLSLRPQDRASKNGKRNVLPGKKTPKQLKKLNKFAYEYRQFKQ